MSRMELTKAQQSCLVAAYRFWQLEPEWLWMESGTHTFVSTVDGSSVSVRIDYRTMVVLGQLGYFRYRHIKTYGAQWAEVKLTSEGIGRALGLIASGEFEWARTRPRTTVSSRAS
jgi:hypothetical protein